MQEPTEVYIGEPYFPTRFTGAKRRLIEKKDSFQYVPLLDSLNVLIQDEIILDYIDNPHNRSDGLLEDFCDAELVKSHPVLSKPQSLQIIAYFDELEVCNPLGTHTKKHKLGIILFTLGNIPPKYRSTLRAINLVACATHPVISKHGIDAILEPFIQDLNTLSSKGISVTINKHERKFTGALVCFLSDNIASNALGGFKESFSFSYRFCRSCLATATSYQKKFTSDSFQNRDDTSHAAQCNEVEGPYGDHFSKTYGINRRSSLTKVPHFSLFNGGLPHDIMHDALEGVVQYEIKLLIRHCIDSNYFTIAEYNRRLIMFNYGMTESDKPTAILTREILRSDDKKFHLSSSQTLLLCRLLPLLIGDCITEGDRHWKCYLLLLKIMDIIVSPVIAKGQCSTLKLLIEEHHISFTNLYGESCITPKFHFMIHYPEQILSLGPLVCSWTMRYESKLQFFKRASHLGNFKNIALTVAQRHQRWMCYQICSDNLVKSNFECGPSKNATVNFSSLPDSLAKSVQDVVPTINDDTKVFNPKWVKTGGNCYTTNNCYIATGSDGLNPTFGEILDIFLVCSNILLLYVQNYTCEYYDDHYHAFVIKASANNFIVNVDNQQYNIILHSHKLFNNSKELYITLKHLYF